MDAVYTKNAPDAIGPYSQAMKVNGLIFTSGQIAINPASGEVEATTIEAQTDHLTEVLRYSEQTFTPQTLHVFRLRYQQRKKYTEIASELQISEVAVYKHLAQALKKIKQHFCQVTTL